MEYRKRPRRVGNNPNVPAGNYENEVKVHSKRIGRLHKAVGKKLKKNFTDRNAFALFFFIVLALLLICVHTVLTRAQTTSAGQSNSYQRYLYDNVQNLQLSLQRKVEAEYLPERPRTIGHYYESAQGHHLWIEHINPNEVVFYDTNAETDMTEEDWERQLDLQDSDSYDSGKADKFEDGDCVAQYEWQKHSFPTSNLLMEIDMTHFRTGQKQSERSVQLIANGYWRDVWRIQEEHDLLVLKTIRYEHDYEPRNYDRHRRDAVAMERLTSSPYVMDIFAYVGNSGLFEFADGGSIEDQIWYNDDDDGKDWTPSERVVIAYQLARGLADAHDAGANKGVPALAHADMTTSQYVYVKEAGIFKLNDFNRCRFLRINKVTNEICPYEVGNNPGTFRSPEEYAYRPQTEKVDVYSLGNVFFGILTSGWPFYKDGTVREAQKRIVEGEKPKIEDKYRNSEDPFDQAMIKAIELCWIYKPEARASARQIENYLLDVLNQHGVTNLKI